MGNEKLKDFTSFENTRRGSSNRRKQPKLFIQTYLC